MFDFDECHSPQLPMNPACMTYSASMFGSTTSLSYVMWPRIVSGSYSCSPGIA
jgi:hypothetical protein